MLNQTIYQDQKKKNAFLNTQAYEFLSRATGDVCSPAVRWLGCSDCVTAFVYGSVKGFVMCAHSRFYCTSVQSRSSITLLSLPTL